MLGRRSSQQLRQSGAAARQRHVSAPAGSCYLKLKLETIATARLPALRQAGTPEDAVVVFHQVFERAEQPHDEGRTSSTQRIFQLL